MPLSSLHTSMLAPSPPPGSWLPFLAQVSFLLLITFGLGCGYLGLLFSKLACALPNATTFDDIGQAALGKLGKRLVFGLVYTT